MDINSLPASTQVEVEDAGRSERLGEPERVLSWRLTRLAEAGYTADAAAVLATCRDIDLHEAIDLLGRGCPQRTALRILL